MDRGAHLQPRPAPPPPPPLTPTVNTDPSRGPVENEVRWRVFCSDCCDVDFIDRSNAEQYLRNHQNAFNGHKPILVHKIIHHVGNDGGAATYVEEARVALADNDERVSTHM